MTLGAVVTRSRLNSRSSRSWIISMCRSPKKPQRKPKPSATEVSGSKERDASFSCSFSKRVPQVGIAGAVRRVDAAEHHGHRLAVAGQRLVAGRSA